MLGLSFCPHSSLEKLDAAELVASLPFGKDEQKRLGGISNSTARTASIASLIALKKLTDIGESNTDLTVARTEHGKPYFTSLPLCFSLTHAGGVSAAAICDKSVGIDLEFVCERKNADRISARFFTAHEQEEFKCADEGSAAFFSIWTKKEALAKLDGRGLSALSSLDTKNGYFRVFRITYNGADAILTLCFKEPNNEEIFILHDDNAENIKIYEQI